MAYLYVVIAAIAFYMGIHRFTELSTKKKIAGSIGFILVIGAIVWFESHNDSQRDRINALAFAYEHDKILICKDDVEVTKKGFNYSVGGHSFLGLANTPYEGLIIPIGSCRIKE